jgi:hypothetical protein
MLPLEVADPQGCTLTKFLDLCAARTIEPAVASPLLVDYTTLVDGDPGSPATALGLSVLTVPKLSFASVSAGWAAKDRWGVAKVEVLKRRGCQVSSVRVDTPRVGMDGRVEPEWEDWSVRAAEMHDLSDRLAHFGYATVVEEARNSGRNFALVGSLIENIQSQPVFVHDALSGYAAIVARVYTLADAGYAFLRSYVRVREGEHARRRRVLVAVLARAILRACENRQSLIARRRANDLLVRDGDLPDAPHRAQPRETRAGPTSKEPSEPGHKPEGCQRGEARSISPAIDGSPAGRVRRWQLLSRSFKTSPTGAGVHV